VAVNHRLSSIIIGMRGTLTPTNIMVDLSWVPLDYNDFPGAPNGAMVHAGFLVAALHISDAIRERLLALVNRYPKYSIDFTGHSLGGAVAQLVALNFGARTSTPTSRIRVMTYGSPRIGNSKFADTVSFARFKGLTRVTYNNDPVPHLP
ncbi:Alpha/Beta hydrolase protein, partial [Thamnocephalis sphaerospora]